MPRLRRVSDGKGDEGSMCTLIWEDENGKIKHEQGRPRLGVQVRVGSITARSYSNYDWYQCTEVLEILEETKDYMKFRTKNSVYEWWR